MTVFFVGAGPGAADLLTLRAVDGLRRCPVCVYAGAHVPDEVLAHCPPGARLVDSRDLTLDEESYEVSRAGIPIELTATEFELLRFLMRNPRRVLSREQILDRVWSYDYGGRSSIVELYISYLRKKVDSLGEPMIHTVRTVGYVLKPAAS